MKKPTNPEASPVALFRYRVLSQVLALELRGEARPAAIETVASGVHFGAHDEPRRVSTRSVYRWLAAYERHGFRALAPTQRTHITCVLAPPLLAFFEQEKRDDPHASLPELIRRARARGLLDAREPICRTTLWRALRRQGVDTTRRPAPKARDCRRFAYPHRLDMTLCDGKHLRAGPHRHRRVAMFFLDDATRFALGVAVGTTENTLLFLRGLYACIRTYGLMTALYVDNGSGFIALDSIDVARQLGVLLIHGTPAYPEGHGKIERFNRTAFDDVLRALDGNPSVDSHCSALQLRLQHYLQEQYNHTPHESLAGQTPAARFHQDPRPLRFAANEARLRQAFVLPVERGVSPDHVVSFEGVQYEVPRGYAGRRITLYRALLDEELSLLHEGRMVPLAPLDPHANARQRRAKSSPEKPAPIPPKTSAQLTFDRQMQPVVDTDGGFSLPKAEDKS